MPFSKVTRYRKKDTCPEDMRKPLSLKSLEEVLIALSQMLRAKGLEFHNKFKMFFPVAGFMLFLLLLNFERGVANQS